MVALSVKRGSVIGVRFDANGLSWICVGLYLLGSLVLLVSLLRHTHGLVVYALDDPYIHLALAEQLAHGHYGINASESTSPSSSLLWPFLLVPLAETRVHALLPLFLNLVCGSGTAWLIGLCLTRWSRLRSRDSLLDNGHLVWTKRVIAGVLLLLVANLWTLTFIGMEHCLQILLATICAFGITEVLSGRLMPVSALVAAAVLPSVRYEGVAITLAVALALYGQRRRWRAPALLVVVSVIPLLGFSIFLHAHGLPMLPNSVMVKSSFHAQQRGAVQHAFWIVLDNLRRGPGNVERWPAALLTCVLLQQWWNETDSQRRWALGGAALALLLQVLVGQNGWFTRYEVYAVIFGTMILVRLLEERPPFLFLYFAGGLLFIAMPYVLSTERVVETEMEIYGQQYQMHRFLRDYYHGNVAVNDLGLVAYGKPNGTYVLDLWGLASTEASTRQHKDAGWLRGITQRHDAALAMIYPSWFESIPTDWMPLGSLCLASTNHCSVFYSTEQTRRAELQGDLARFAKTLPATTEFLPGVVHYWTPT